MEHSPIELADPTQLGASTRHELGNALGTTDVAINFYRIAPGEGLPAGLHAHFDQEEVFLILEGTAVFETFDGEVTVENGEAIRFAPGEFQSGHNGGDESLRLLALGAPKGTSDIRIPVDCQRCSAEALRLDFGAELAFACPECDERVLPADCPSCGCADLDIQLATDEPDAATETVCQDCGAVFASPPIKG